MAKTSESWWTTFPGILTGLAAVITAVTGLIVGYNRITPSAAEKTATPWTTASSVESAPPKGPASVSKAVAIALPSPSEVKLNSGETVIQILKVELQPYNAEKKALKFTVRYTNNGRSMRTSGNVRSACWSTTFRSHPRIHWMKSLPVTVPKAQTPSSKFPSPW
jgi:hypothetical protein